MTSFDDEGTSDADVTDDGEMEPETKVSEDEALEDTDALIKSSVRQYLKTLPEQDYLKIIGKDAYAFLKGHEEDVIEILTVGYEVAPAFKTLSVTDVKEVYRIILNEIQYVGWSKKHMEYELLQKFPQLDDYEAERIIRTELTRILFYAKEQFEERTDGAEYNYGWMGPLDDRTTPMCYYMQTGELRPSDIKLLESNGHTASDLPYIPEEGLPLEQLKEACRLTAECFGYDMVSDWVMHINCRHSFARGNRALEPEIATDEELQQLLDMFELEAQEQYETETVEDNIGDMYFGVVPEDSGTMIIQVYDDYPTYIFPESIYGMPVMYKSYSEDIIVFKNLKESQLGGLARLVIELQDDGIDELTIIYAIKDTMHNLDDDAIGYTLAHASEILNRADAEGWLI